MFKVFNLENFYIYKTLLLKKKRKTKHRYLFKVKLRKRKLKKLMKDSLFVNISLRITICELIIKQTMDLF